GGKRQDQDIGALTLARQFDPRMPVHRGAGVAPQPNALCRGPLGLAQEQTVRFRRLAPIDAGGGFTWLILPELPERLAGAHAPASVHALLDRGGDPQRRNEKRRQSSGEPLGLAPRRLSVERASAANGGRRSHA